MGLLKLRLSNYETQLINLKMKAHVWIHGNPLIVKRIEGGVYKFIDGKFIKVQERPDMETSLDTLTDYAKEIANVNADKRDEARVEDAKLYAIASKSKRYGARSSAEMELMAKEGF